jgi:hypothetical protein
MLSRSNMSWCLPSQIARVLLLLAAHGAALGLDAPPPIVANQNHVPAGMCQPGRMSRRGSSERLAFVGRLGFRNAHVSSGQVDATEQIFEALIRANAVKNGVD